MKKLVLLRHGESEWNLTNRFTGWTDVDLTARGVNEAQVAGQALQKAGFTFDLAYTSRLKRAIKTGMITLETMDLLWIPVYKSWQLNERHYGALQGLNKAETTAQYGEAQVQIWRRSYAVRPPAITPADSRYPGNDSRYQDIPPDQLPLGESLQDTVNRFLPYWEHVIAPKVKTGQRVIIIAHGNTLRALIKYLDLVSEEAIVKLNIPTGIPLVYELDADLKPLTHYYLGDPDAVAAAAQAVANQGQPNC